MQHIDPPKRSISNHGGNHSSAGALRCRERPGRLCRPLSYAVCRSMGTPQGHPSPTHSPPAEAGLAQRQRHHRGPPQCPAAAALGRGRHAASAGIGGEEAHPRGQRHARWRALLHALQGPVLERPGDRAASHIGRHRRPAERLPGTDGQPSTGRCCTTDQGHKQHSRCIDSDARGCPRPTDPSPGSEQSSGAACPPRARPPAERAQL